MYRVNDDLSISVTRGDACWLSISAKEKNGKAHEFQVGDVVKLAVCEKKNCNNVVFSKRFPVVSSTETVELFLSSQDTKIGDVISKPVDYWYEVELNPDTDAAQTILAYDEEGTRIFKLFPEVGDSDGNEPTVMPEDVPVVDTILDVTSARPVENRVIAVAILQLQGEIERLREALAELQREEEG